LIVVELMFRLPGSTYLRCAPSLDNDACSFISSSDYISSYRDPALLIYKRLQCCSSGKCFFLSGTPRLHK
jgi:hypothetical protein